MIMMRVIMMSMFNLHIYFQFSFLHLNNSRSVVMMEVFFFVTKLLLLNSTTESINFMQISGNESHELI